MQTFFHLYVDTNENQAKWTLSCFIDTHSKKHGDSYLHSVATAKWFNLTEILFITWSEWILMMQEITTAELHFHNELKFSEASPNWWPKKLLFYIISTFTSRSGSKVIHVRGRIGSSWAVTNHCQFHKLFSKIIQKKTCLFGSNLTNLLSPNQIAIQLTNLLIKANFQTPNAIVSIK